MARPRTERHPNVPRERDPEVGTLTARERVETLLDPGSFEELDALVVHRNHEFGMQRKRIEGDGVITGHGMIDGRPVVVFAHEREVFGGSLSEAQAGKICKVIDLAEKAGIPIIGLNDSGGARIQDGVDALAGYTDIFLRNTLLSGVVPQISAIFGPCAGGAVYSPALSDFTIMTRDTSFMFITGPDIVHSVMREKVTMDRLGGAATHTEKSGVAHFAADDDRDALRLIRELLAFLPASNRETPPRAETTDPPERAEQSLNTLIPENRKMAFDVLNVIHAIVDHGRFFQVHANFARNIVVGFARLDGRPVGIVANQSSVLAGVLDIKASRKAARFVRFCDCFNIPIVVLEDVPGFLPGTDQELGGIISHGAKLLYAFAEATVPKLTVIMRKAYGGAYCAMASKKLRADFNFAWPTAEIAVMGPEGAVNILYRRDLAAAEQNGDADAVRRAHVDAFCQKFANPYVAAERGFVDEVIEPASTRAKLISGLRLLAHKRSDNPRRKHGNMPL